MPATLITPLPGTVSLGPALPYVINWAYDPADGEVTRTELYVSRVSSGSTDALLWVDATGTGRSAEAPALELGLTYYLQLWYIIAGSWHKVSCIFGLGAVLSVAPTPQPQRGATRLDLDDRLVAAFVPVWNSCTPPAPLTAMPIVVSEASSFRPANQQPYVVIDVLTAEGNQWGTPGERNYEIPGTVQVAVYTKTGDGGNLATALIKLVSATLEQLDGFVQGLHLYGCRKPHDAPSPLPGYFGRMVDTPARYAGP